MNLRKLWVVFVGVVVLAGCSGEPGQTAGSRLDSSYSESRSEPALPATGSGPAGTVQIVGGDESSLREFITRWFAPLYPSTTPVQDTNIWMGQVPESITPRFPLPEGAEVIASVQDPYTTLQVIADVAGTPEEVLAAYPEVLTEEGWVLVDPVTGGGFVTAADPWFVYCNPDQAALTVQVFSTASGKTEVRLNLYTTNSKFMCEPGADQNMDAAYRMIPELKVPLGALMTSGGSSSGNGSAESSSEIQTGLAPEELVNHFSPQLKKAGWEYLDGGEADNFSWGSWMIEDSEGQTWSGMLIVLENPIAKDLIYAEFHVIRIAE